MNYIEETLRRQAVAFAVLLSGGQSPGEDAEKWTGDSRDAGMQSNKGKGALRVLPQPPLPSTHLRTKEPGRRQRFPGEMEEWNQALARQRKERLYQVTGTQESMAAENFPARSIPEEFIKKNLGGVETETGFGDTGGRWFRDAFSEREEDDAQTVLVVDGGVSAGELSRTFQRDARRYDGGYPLY